MNHKIDKNEFKKSVVANVRNLYRKNIEEATAAQVYHAVALAVKDMIIDRWIATHEEYDKQDAKIVYYMSMEFLTGRFLGNNIINLCEQEEIAEALKELGFDLNAIEDQERDPALGKRRSWPPGRLLFGFLIYAGLSGLRPAESAIATACSASRSRTATRSRFRTNG